MIEAGKRFFDERGSRYLTVESVREDSETILCKVEEIGEELEDAGSQLFTFTEARHWKEV